ncbi:PspC domain-containing protein [Lactobacillus sp. Sy-1]|uniref:PspC domain-containing protein n=1 Tax=Lactobacillus sp. Sy-1 TaxID=2109645 RepID=UPI001C5B4A42|nr:PspC domain-containing protein [Lactobacillus sp. Sy-1]MBW1605961.1 PspC domain-containing protein [Lactobacillus sp. Sy-1]
MKVKKLTKSRNNRILTGVLGGVAEYFGLNARYLRIGYFIFTLIFIHSLIPILLYVAMTVFIPNDYGNKSSANGMFSGRFNHYGSNPDDRSRHDRKILHDVEEKDDSKRG